MLTKDDGGNIFYPSEFLGDSSIKAAINQVIWVHQKSCCKELFIFKVSKFLHKSKLYAAAEKMIAFF